MKTPFSNPLQNQSLHNACAPDGAPHPAKEINVGEQPDPPAAKDCTAAENQVAEAESPASKKCAPREDDDKPNLAAYRGRTIGLLRRYFRMSIDLGRLPSILGREFFRAKVTSYRMTSFEDAIIFVHDVERSLEKLLPQSQQLIAQIVFQNYSYDEAARHFGCTSRTIANRFPAAVDQLTEILVEAKLMEIFVVKRAKTAKKP